MPDAERTERRREEAKSSGERDHAAPESRGASTGTGRFMREDEARAKRRRFAPRPFALAPPPPGP